MKIVNRTQFLALPPGTVFMNYHPMVFGDLSIKGDTFGACDGFPGDFYRCTLAGAVAADDSGAFHDNCDAMQGGASMPIEFCYSRDGMFDPDQLFAIYEPADVELMIEALQEGGL